MRALWNARDPNRGENRTVNGPIAIVDLGGIRFLSYLLFGMPFLLHGTDNKNTFRSLAMCNVYERMFSKLPDLWNIVRLRFLNNSITSSDRMFVRFRFI
ncbi:hypothetical protein CEXT_96971 [Caerostris extrusa]|uniref:Uncharacterized protein n=1 Tax=Caerostris extrusa TaxID=172846 RepID=A0AAV4NNW8_CAEEX|nr:hypothetical protein CEXT_96971 [Caerostris extrusa]